MRTKEFEDEHVDVIITPFVDVFIFLLIAFMAGMILQKITNSLEMELPPADYAQRTTTPDEMLIITILPKKGPAISLGKAPSHPRQSAPNSGIVDDCQYVVGTEMVGRNDLNRKLREAAGRPDQRVRIDCDQSIPFRQVAYVLDILQFVGLHNINVRTRDSVGGT